MSLETIKSEEAIAQYLAAWEVRILIYQLALMRESRDCEFKNFLFKFILEKGKETNPAAEIF